MRTSFFSVLLLTSIAAPALAAPGTPEEVLGDAYRQAAPADRIVMLCIAETDKTLESKVVRPAIEQNVRTAIAPGETPEARLKLLGELRKATQEKLKAKNDERKATKTRSASFLEPDSDTQNALALEYVSVTAGPSPTLEALGCLKLVREATSWGAHHKLVLSLAAEALNRDAGYREADLEGKLRIIQTLAVDRSMLSDHERTYLESPLLTDHLSARLKAGDAPDALVAQVKALRDKALICFFTQSYADSMLKRMAELRAARAPR